MGSGLRTPTAGRTGVHTVRTWLPADPPNWDPHTGVDDWSMRLHAAVFEGLTRPGPGGELQAALASSWQVDDSGKVVTISLRPGARWSDGREVRADDVVYAIERGTDPALKLRAAWQMYVIAGSRRRHQGDPTAILDVTAVDQHTVRMALDHQVPYLPQLWALPPFAPLRRDAPPSTDPAEATAVPSSGPYRYRTLEPGRVIELEPNLRYWDGQLPSAPVRYLIGGDPVELFLAGEVDLAPLEIRDLEQVDPADVVRVPEATVSYLVMNTRDGQLAEHGVRSALVAGLDPEALVAAQGSGAVPLRRLVPDSPGTADYLANSADVSVRRRERASLEGLRLSLVCTDLPDRVTEARLVADHLHRYAGVIVQIDPRPYREHYTAIRTGGYQLSLASWRADFDDPMAFLAEHVSDGVAGNQSKWSDARYDTAVHEARNTTDSARCTGLLATAEQRLLDHDAVRPLYSWSGLWLQRAGLRGVVHRPTGASPDLRWVSRQ